MNCTTMVMPISEPHPTTTDDVSQITITNDLYEYISENALQVGALKYCNIITYSFDSNCVCLILEWYMRYTYMCTVLQQH